MLFSVPERVENWVCETSGMMAPDLIASTPPTPPVSLLCPVTLVAPFTLMISVLQVGL